MSRFNFNGVIGEVHSLPGCSQVGVSHAVFTPPTRRGRGFGKEAHAERIRFMKNMLGYDYAMCTVDSNNEAQKAILQEAGWSRLDAFTSSKTDHQVLIYGKNLSDV